MRLRTALLAAGLALAPTTTPALADDAPSSVEDTQNGVTLGVGRGTMIRLPRAVADVFIANEKIADVQMRSPTQVYVFGTGAGETSIYATDKGGKVVWSGNVRVGQNIDGIKPMLALALPGAPIEVTPLNGMVLLTGTVGTPSEVEEAGRLVGAFVGDKTTVVNKLRTSTPVQVNLQVKIAEVSRELVRELGVNLLTRDTTGGFLFGIARGRDFATIGTNSVTFNAPTDGSTAIGLARRIAGVDVAAAIDMLEQDGVVTVLAEPNLTALSGETASFLAGGEFPIVVSNGNGSVSVEFKQYGVGLAFTPTVLDGNHISMRVKPEVSELSDAGAVQINGNSIPGLTTRRAETTVELGSGQSFMIAGLLRNGTNTSGNRTPVLGNLPIIGALFRSDRFRRNETELVIVITPYLVKPMAPSQVKLPTDGYQAPNDMERWLLGKTFKGKNASTRPQPRQAPAAPQAMTGAAAAPAAPGFSN